MIKIALKIFMLIAKFIISQMLRGKNGLDHFRHFNENKCSDALAVLEMKWNEIWMLLSIWRMWQWHKAHESSRNIIGRTKSLDANTHLLFCIQRRELNKRMSLYLAMHIHRYHGHRATILSSNMLESFDCLLFYLHLRVSKMTPFFLYCVLWIK